MVFHFSLRISAIGISVSIQNSLKYYHDNKVPRRVLRVHSFVSCEFNKDVLKGCSLMQKHLHLRMQSKQGKVPPERDL